MCRVCACRRNREVYISFGPNFIRPREWSARNPGESLSRRGNPPRGPAIEQAALEVILQHLGSSAVKGPERAVRADIDQVYVGRFVAHVPFVEIFTVFVEYWMRWLPRSLTKMRRLRIDSAAVHVIEVARAFSLGGVLF
jgi:hypothetical protein